MKSSLSQKKVDYNSEVNVIEVRRGTVLGYLSEGMYTGEQCVLSEGIVRYPSNITAMENTELLYLTKDSLAKVKEAFPEIQTSIRNVLRQRENSEHQRRLFNDAARGDDTLTVRELHKMLKEKLYFTQEEIDEVKMDFSGDDLIDEYEFVSFACTTCLSHSI